MRAGKKQKYNYGECEICDAPLEEQYIKQDFWVRGELIVIDHILAGVCPRCGEKVVKAEVGQRVDKLLKNTARIAMAPRLSVPIIAFDEYEEPHVPVKQAV